MLCIDFVASGTITTLQNSPQGNAKIIADLYASGPVVALDNSIAINQVDENIGQLPFGIDGSACEFLMQDLSNRWNRHKVNCFSIFK